jgi:hypothetical protein
MKRSRTLDKVSPLFTFAGRVGMLRVKVHRLRRGLHPNEVIVAVTTADGSREELVVDKRSLRDDDTIRIGYPVAGEDGRLLVELPRESFRGINRVWVFGESLVPDEAAA